MGKTALLIIDAQQEYFAPVGKMVLPDATTFAPGSPALEIYPVVAPKPGETVIKKHMPGSFTGTIVSGFMTQMCCDTTAREAAHRGFKVLLLADATAAMDLKAPDGTVIPHDQVHRTHLASLNGFLAQVTTTDQVVK